MKIREKVEGENLTLLLEGDLDETSSPIVEEEVERALSENVKKIYFDLKGINYISSIGVRVLILAYKKSVKSGKAVVIERMSQKARDVLETVGILSLFVDRERQERCL